MRRLRARSLYVFMLVCGFVAQLVVGVVPGSAAVASAPATPLCGVGDLAAVTPPTQPAPTGAVSVVARGLVVSALATNGTTLYALDRGARTVRLFGLDGAPAGSFSVPWTLANVPLMAVDPGGNVYLARYPSTVVKLSPSGAELWSRDVGAEIDGLLSIGSGPGSRVAVVRRGTPGSTLLDSAGSQVGSSTLVGNVYAPAADGGVLTTDERYVRRFDSGGRLVSTFGDSRKGNDPQMTGGPLHFYQQGGAAVGPDGKVYVADATRGIHATSAEGFYQGFVADDAIGTLTERSWFAPVGDRLYFAAGGRFSGNQNISSIRFSDLAALVTAPKAPTLVLGFGAGLTSGVTGNYFAPGQNPAVAATFDPWWTAHAPGLRLSYTVRERKQVLAQQTVAATELALPGTAAGLASVALALPPARPGAYEVDARLLAGSAVVGATCLNYTVGAAGHRLDFAGLPAGADYGGPAPARGVALADQLGIGGMRSVVEWTRLLPQGAGGPMDFSAYDAAFAAAAREAAGRGVAWWVQVGQGLALEKALVADGTWERRVRELVTHFKGVVPAWEAWNEPNNSFGPADAYVSKVLAPFSRAVRAADPATKIIGASVLDMDLAYFDAIGNAGGYSMMDIVGSHPYPGHNRSLEEHAIPPQFTALRTLLARHGAGSKPVWITELAWWSDGPGNYYAQADKAARTLLWTRALNIERWAYLITEGAYGDYGLTYALIQLNREPDYVKPAALATMTAAAQTAGRSFVGMVDTGVPHSYTASFATRAGDSSTLLAAWTDDLPITATLRLDAGAPPATVTVTDVLGDARSISLTPDAPATIALSGSPVYITAPAGAQPRLGPTEPFGGNRAAAAAGARASASSAAPTNPPSAAIDGVSDAAVRGDLIGIPAWASAPGDAAPTLTVSLPQRSELNRIIVSTHSLGSIVPGVRSYDVEVQDPSGSWATVGQVRDQFFARRAVVGFAPRPAVAVRVSVSTVNYGGLAGGVKPWFWPTDRATLADAGTPWYGPAVIYELEAYSGTVGEPATTTTTAPATTTTTTTPATTTTTTAPATTARPRGSGPAAVGDYDGNGTTDIAVFRPADGTWYIRGGPSVALGGSGDIPVPGDYDGDGKTEMVVFRADGTWDFGGGRTAAYGVQGDLPVPGDYDGDGRTNLAVWRPSNGTWYVHSGASAHWGISGDVPVPGDYDGNGTTDIAVFRPSDGTWYVLDRAPVHWGIRGDVPVPGDYDGNGTTDIAVFRPSDGTWYLSGGVMEAYGASGDVPVPGDFDGDGRTNLAVWRPSSGTWYVHGGTAATWGLAGDIPLPLPSAIRTAYFR